MRTLMHSAIIATLVILLGACGTITICKQTQPPGGAGFPFTATNGNAPAPVPLPPFTLNDAQCKTMKLTLATFTENVPAGWLLTNISCGATTTSSVKFGVNANPAFQLGDNTVTIDRSEPNVICAFVNRQAPPCCAFSLDLSTGQGPWSVNGGNAYVTPPVSSWTVMPPAQWIQPVASPTPANVPPGVYKYTIAFNVPTCGLGHVQLTGALAADNDATAILDSSPIASCSNCFGAPVPFNVPVTTAAAHLLEIDVTNHNGYSGLIVNAQVRQICP